MRYVNNNSILSKILSKWKLDLAYVYTCRHRRMSGTESFHIISLYKFLVSTKKRLSAFLIYNIVRII